MLLPVEDLYFSRRLRLVSTQENYLWIGTGKKIFICVKVISSNPKPILVTRPFRVKNMQTFKMADVKISRLWELMHRSNSPHWGFIV
jgi:hypothetical protein